MKADLWFLQQINFALMAKKAGMRQSKETYTKQRTELILIPPRYQYFLMHKTMNINRIIRRVDGEIGWTFS